MNTCIKKFLHRGLVFAGFGPVVMGIIYAVLEYTIEDLNVSGTEICLAIVSTYFLAFIQAGVSVFNQMEEWSIAKSTACHFTVLYLAYILCYLINTWIPFRWEVLLLFTVIFAVGYCIIWLSVVISIKLVSQKINKKLSDVKSNENKQ